MKPATFTTSAPHGVRPGDMVSFTVRDTRWWRRLLYWALRKGTPQRTITRRVTDATTTTIELEPMLR